MLMRTANEKFFAHISSSVFIYIYIYVSMYVYKTDEDILPILFFGNNPV